MWSYEVRQCSLSCLTLPYSLNQKNPNTCSFLATRERNWGKFGENCVSFPFCLSHSTAPLAPHFQVLQTSASKHSKWNANLSPANLGWQYCASTALMTLITFQIFTIQWDKLNLFSKEFKVGLTVFEGEDNGGMFVVAICNNLMLTESSILFSN